MTNKQHPIVPSEGLKEEWESEWHHYQGQDTYEEFMARQAAQWGADQELAACCTEVTFWGSKGMADRLQATRRPKSSSLKEQALEAATRFYAKGHEGCTDEEVTDDYHTIRRALEQLNG